MLAPVTEMRLFDLRVTVERIEGRSVCGLEVGDWFEVTESSRVRIPEGRHFCLYALQSVIPLLPAKMRRLPEEDWLEQDKLVCCPDPDERVVMRIERLARAVAGDRGADVARELGIGLLTDQEPEAYEAIARRVDEAGIDVLSVYHDLLYQPAIGPLLLMARVTERVRLGPAALNPFTLHPYEIAARSRCSTRCRAGGRTSGSQRARGSIGSGSTNGGRSARSARRSRSCRRCSRGTRPAWRRALHPLARDDARVPAVPGGRAAPRRHLGARDGRWAGTVADEVKVGGSANPEFVPVVREWLGNPRVKSCSAPSSVVDEDGDWARERARAAVAPYLEVVAGLDPTVDRDGAAPRSSASASPGRRRRSRRGSRSSGTRARIASSSARRKGGRHRRASS